jgi:hypothetical protein
MVAGLVNVKSSGILSTKYELFAQICVRNQMIVDYLLPVMMCDSSGV